MYVKCRVYTVESRQNTSKYLSKQWYIQNIFFFFLIFQKHFTFFFSERLEKCITFKSPLLCLSLHGQWTALQRVAKICISKWWIGRLDDILYGFTEFTTPTLHWNANIFCDDNPKWPTTAVVRTGTCRNKRR